MEMGPTELLPGTQYYRGDHDGESYGRGVLPNLNDQLTSFSTTPRAFTCVAGTIMVMHYDLWHRALECSDEHSNRLMLKFAAWRTDPGVNISSYLLPFTYITVREGRWNISFNRYKRKQSVEEVWCHMLHTHRDIRL
jgi:hypothetical protein